MIRVPLTAHVEIDTTIKRDTASDRPGLVGFVLDGVARRIVVEHDGRTLCTVDLDEQARPAKVPRVDLDAVRADLWAVVEFPLIRRDVNWYAALDRLAAAAPALVAEVGRLRAARVATFVRDVRRDAGGHCVGCDASEHEDCTARCVERSSR